MATYQDSTTVSYISQATPILPPEKLYPTPSMQDGLPYEVEFDLRLIGCELIQTSGRLLRLPQTAMATAQVLFHRYYYSKSFVKNNMEHYAMAAIFLSSKIEECPRRIRDVMNVFNHIKQVRTGKMIRPLLIDQSYYEIRNQIIKAERRILKELGFCVHVKHPHKIIFIYLQMMECTQKELVQKAWNYMNDCLRTDVFLRYSPETIACACIYLSARELQIPLPTNPHWYTMFGVQEDALKLISMRLIHLYTHKTKPYEELEKTVNECRDKYTHERKRIFTNVLPTSNEGTPTHVQATSDGSKGSATPAEATATEHKDTPKDLPKSDDNVIKNYNGVLNDIQKKELNVAQKGSLSSSHKKKHSEKSRERRRSCSKTRSTSPTSSVSSTSRHRRSKHKKRSHTKESHGRSHHRSRTRSRSGSRHRSSGHHHHHRAKDDRKKRFDDRREKHRSPRSRADPRNVPLYTY